MNIHEYQAKALLRSYGIPVSDGRVVLRAEEAKTAAANLMAALGGEGADPPPAGAARASSRKSKRARRAASGWPVRWARRRNSHARCWAARLSPSRPAGRGKQVNRIYIEDGSDIERELYLALLIDRKTSRISFVASTEGGMSIEDVAHDTPEKIVSFDVDPATTGLSDFHGRRVAFALGLSGNQVKQCVGIVRNLYKLFVEKDMDMLEINPFVVLKDGNLKLLDAKMSFDGNAIYRHPDIASLRDETEEDPKELAASKFDLNYIALDGEIAAW